MGPPGLGAGRFDSSLLAVLLQSPAMLHTSCYTASWCAQSCLMVPVGVVALMGPARAWRVDHGHQACGEVVATVKYTVDLGMELEKRFYTPDDG